MSALGQTPRPQAWANLSGLTEPFYWFVAPLASQLRGVSMPSGPSADHPNCHIYAEFNLSFDDLPVGTGRWYYGIDGLVPGDDHNFLSTALHEIGHSLGIVEETNTATGENGPLGMPFWLLNFVVRRGSTNLFFEEMSNAERLAALTSGEVYFSGPAIKAAQIPNPSTILDPNNPPVNAIFEAKLYAPNPLNSGAALRHWDPFHRPDGRQMLMAFSATGPIMNIGYLKEMLIDLGWTFQSALEVQISPGNHLFPNTHINAGPSIEKTITITSVGPVTLQILGMELIDGANGGADQFEITSSTAPSLLAPTQTREITVVFDPDTNGAQSAFLRIFQVILTNGKRKFYCKVLLSTAQQPQRG